jgi:hypothetical protein
MAPGGDPAATTRGEAEPSVERTEKPPAGVPCPTPEPGPQARLGRNRSASVGVCLASGKA